MAYGVSGERLELWVADLSQNTSTFVTLGSVPSWSPDGKTLAFACFENFQLAVCTVREDGTDIKRLTDDQGHDFLPQWSPDGSRLAFWSTRDGDQELYVMEPDGTGQSRLTDVDQGHTFDWSTDGGLIVFGARVDGNWDIYVVGLDGGAPRRMTDDPGVQGWPSFTP